MRTAAPTPASHSAFYLLHLQYVSGVNLVDSASHSLSGPERGVCDSTTCLQVGMMWYLVNCTSAHHDLSLAARCFVCLSLFRTDTLFLSSTEATRKIHLVPSPTLELPVYTTSKCTWLSLIHWPQLKRKLSNPQPCVEYSYKDGEEPGWSQSALIYSNSETPMGRSWVDSYSLWGEYLWYSRVKSGLTLLPELGSQRPFSLDLDSIVWEFPFSINCPSCGNFGIEE